MKVGRASSRLKEELFLDEIETGRFLTSDARYDASFCSSSKIPFQGLIS